MRYGKCYFLHIIIITVAIGGLTGCVKENGINNNTVIRTPYSLYFSDKLGALYNTNDGKNFKAIFPTDGYAARGLTTSGLNIIWIKNNLHLSADNGLNFNPRSFRVSPLAKGQSMILDVPGFRRMYMASTRPGGIEFSDDNGLMWQDDFWDVTPTSAVTSFTQIKDGKLYALDNTGPRIFEKLDSNDLWTEVIMATPLPTGNFFLSHFNNSLVAADVTAGGGIYYSNDNGVNWAAHAGMPTNQEIFSVAAPFDQVLLAGTDSAGIYRLVGNTFQPANNGLEPFTKVYGIVGKQDMYKNETIKQYIYIATNNGLFRSEDLGQNWTLARPGDIRTLY